MPRECWIVTRVVCEVVGKRRLELLRLAAHDPKSCSSANSDTSPGRRDIPSGGEQGMVSRPGLEPGTG